MSTVNNVLRRRFIAIATGTFTADATYPQLDVESEVKTVAKWLMDDTLGDRRFSDQGFELLAHDPEYSQIRELLTNGEFNEGDAVFLYVTGHGQSEQGAHWVVLRDSEPGKLSQMSLGTAELIRWLAAYRDLSHVLLIIDLCQAGAVLDELPAALRRDLPREWIALLTTPADSDAKVGAFAGVVESVISDLCQGSDRDAGDLEPYLESEVFIKRVKRRLREAHSQDLTILQDPYETSLCLPNPRYDSARLDRSATSAARRDLAMLQQDMAGYWGPRAPVTVDGGEDGTLFTGRVRLMSELIAFAEGPPGTLVVSGRAGCGKSAALARLVTCSDPVFRAEHSRFIATPQPVPPESAVDVAVLAIGKTVEQIAAQIGHALGADRAAITRGTVLDAWIDIITASLADRAEPLTVVIDALDEATDPIVVASTLLERLNPREQPRLRLLLGIRSAGGGPAQVGGGRAVMTELMTRASEQPGSDLADIISVALGARRLWVDGDQLWDPEDLIEFVLQVLTLRQSPYYGNLAQARAIAEAVGQSAGRSYLLAGLVARSLTESEQTLTADDPRLRTLLAQGITDLVGTDLRTSIPYRRDRVRALLLLRASALAFGRGIPWRGVWPVVATAIAADGTQIGDSDIEWLLGHRVSGYLVRDLEDGVAVYRPFHDELRSVLVAAAGLYAAADVPGGYLDLDEAHRRIARDLVRAITGNGGPL